MHATLTTETSSKAISIQQTLFTLPPLSVFPYTQVSCSVLNTVVSEEIATFIRTYMGTLRHE
jgi:hypothetical protein